MGGVIAEATANPNHWPMVPESDHPRRTRKSQALFFFLKFDSELDSTSNRRHRAHDGHGAQEPAEWKILIDITNFVSALCAACWLS